MSHLSTDSTASTLLRRAQLSCLSLLIAFAMVISSAAHSQVVQWTALSPGTPGDPDLGAVCAYAQHTMAVDAQGNTLITGTMDPSGALITKLSPGGSQVWSVTPSAIGQSCAVAVDAAGDVFVAGTGLTVMKLAGSSGARQWLVSSEVVSAWSGFVRVDAQGDVYLIGQGNKAVRVVKLRGSDGSLLWDHEDPDASILTSAAIDGNGNLVVVGRALVNSAGRPVAMKYMGASGVRSWKFVWPEGQIGSGNIAADVAIDANNDVVFTGNIERPSLFTEADYITVKIDGNTGLSLWSRTFSGSSNGYNEANAVVINAAGDVFVTGSSPVYNAILMASPTNYATIKYRGSDGEQQWVSWYSSSCCRNERATAIAIDSDGFIAVAGRSYNLNSDSDDFATVRYDPASGTQLWAQFYSTLFREGDGAFAISAAADGIIVAGSSTSGNGDFGVVKYDTTSGSELWRARDSALMGESLPCFSYSPESSPQRPIAVDNAGSTIVVGCGFNGFDQDFVTAKFSPSGALLWATPYRGPANGLDSAASAAVDSAGDVIVSGTSMGANGWFDFFTLKYRGSDGSQLWAVRYDGPGQGVDSVTGLAIDSAGDVYVTGYSQSLGSTGTDILTIRYRGSDGTALWNSSYSAPIFGDDIPHAITIGQGGQVLVAGQSQQTPANPDYVTISYNGLNGQIQWVKTYASPDNRQEIARAITTDSSGDVLVCGESNLDAVTLKYRASDGAELWSSRRLDREAVSAIATDSNGNAFVLSRPRTGPPHAFELQKLAAATGSSQWVTPVTALTGRGNHLIVGADDNPVVAARMSLIGEREQFYALKFDSSNGSETWRVAPGLLAQSLGSAALALANDGSLLMASSVLAETGPRIAVSKLRVNGELFGDGFEQ